MNNKLSKDIKSVIATHEIYYHFVNYMKRWYYKKYIPFSLRNKNSRELKEFDPSKMVGYQAMCRVERYEKKYGKIKIVYVDDEVFMTSMIVLIPSIDMGISCIYIPQCVNPSNTFFLYPSDIKQLDEAIEQMKKEYLKNAIW